MYGTLSMKPDKIIETNKIKTKAANLLPLVHFAKKAAKSANKPDSLKAPTTTKIPIKKKIVSQSRPFTSPQISRHDFFWQKRCQSRPKIPRAMT